MRLETYTHEFVEFIPEHLEPGVVYVSLTYATAVHLCMCGCGHESTMPLSPQRWRLVFDGETVSLTDSVGNWSFECQSHYWLDRGRVDWSGGWSRARIESNRVSTRRRLELAFEADPDPASAQDVPTGRLHRLWSRLRPRP